MDLDAAELARRIAAGEGPSLEFKSGLPGPGKLARTLAAFANSRGGLVLIGVADNRALLGAPRPEETAREVRAIAAREVDPPLEPHVAVVAMGPGGQQRLVACWQPRSAAGPHRVLNAAGEPELPVRVGASNRAASGATLRALLSGGRPGPTDALEKRVLEWVSRRPASRQGGSNGATAAAFALEQNIGLARSKKAFLALERSGLLYGSGEGAKRFYCRP
jgi:hypothetical protein